MPHGERLLPGMRGRGLAGQQVLGIIAVHVTRISHEGPGIRRVSAAFTNCVALDGSEGFSGNNTRVFQWDCNRIQAAAGVS
jgi:hypothetical protein